MRCVLAQNKICMKFLKNPNPSISQRLNKLLDRRINKNISLNCVNSRQLQTCDLRNLCIGSILPHRNFYLF